MRRIGLGLFIIGITFAKAYGQEDYGPVNTGAANYLTISADARSAAMGGVGVAAPGGDHAVFHNGAAALSDVTRRGGVAYTYSPWMRDYESGYSLHSLGSFYKINQRNAILQRGGSPTPFDRNLSTRMGGHATELIANGQFGRMIALKGDEISSVALEEVAGKLKLVTEEHDLVVQGRRMGICFG